MVNAQLFLILVNNKEFINDYSSTSGKASLLLGPICAHLSSVLWQSYCMTHYDMSITQSSSNEEANGRFIPFILIVLLLLTLL